MLITQFCLGQYLSLWSAVFLVAKFCHLVTEKSCNFTKDFLGEKPPNSSHFEGTEVELPYLDYRLLHVVKYIVPGVQKILIFSVSCSQIWLRPLVEDYQSTFLTNLKRKKKKNPTFIMGISYYFCLWLFTWSKLIGPKTNSMGERGVGCWIFWVFIVFNVNHNTTIKLWKGTKGKHE